MYCTGGIRLRKIRRPFCVSEGIDDVVHLKGGILKYLETVPEEKSLWRGECFVFDQRVSVGHDLAPGTYAMCYACRQPITDDDMASPHYIKGVSCPHCHGALSDEKKKNFAERQKQVELSAARGEAHIGERQEQSSNPPNDGFEDEIEGWGTVNAGDDLPVLYSFRRCPYAMRARMALAVSTTNVSLRGNIIARQTGRNDRRLAKGHSTGADRCWRGDR